MPTNKEKVNQPFLPLFGRAQSVPTERAVKPVVKRPKPKPRGGGIFGQALTHMQQVRQASDFVPAAETLDGRVVFPGDAADGRPAKPIQRSPVVPTPPANVLRLERMIQNGTLGERKPKQVGRQVRVSMVRRKPEGVDWLRRPKQIGVAGKITGYSQNAVYPHPSELDASGRETLLKMVAIVREKLGRKP